MSIFFLEDTDLSEIIKHRLYLSGGSGPYTKKERLKQLKITHILSVTLFPPKTHHDDIVYKHINIDDMSNLRIIDYFPECYNFIGEFDSLSLLSLPSLSFLCLYV